MAMITDPDDLVVDTNLTINTTTKTFDFVVAGALTSAKEGVTLQALWSKFIDLWATSTYQPYDFPMNVIDARSGQFIFGQDPGGDYNGWKPGSDATRQMLRGGGFQEYSAAGVLNREYVGIVALASGYPAGAQFYYQLTSSGAATNFTFTDAPNEAIQVYGDASNGNFDNRTYFRIFCREEAYTYDDAVLADVGETATGPYKVQLPVSVNSDLKIQDTDSNMSNAPYSGITITYYGADQSKTIGAGSYPFRIIVAGNGASLEDIYTKVQYLLRQNSDIDSGVGTVTGKTASSLMYFEGDTLKTTQGVFIENFNTNDTNRVVFLDQNSVSRQFPFVSAGAMTFNAPLVTGGAGQYKMFYAVLPGASNDYGEASAVAVIGGDSNPISGTISSGSIGFTYDYDGDTTGGRTVSTDTDVVLVASNPGYAKPVVVYGTLTASKGLVFTAVAEVDRAYIA